MFIQAIHLKHFRNVEEAWIEFCDGINWFAGPNAAGKTNLLEALFYFVRASSFRTRHLSDLVQTDKPHALLEIFFVKCGVEQSLKLQIVDDQKLLFHNQTSYKTALELLGILQGVLIKLDDSGLISGPPQVRRSFIDLQLVQASPLYVHHLLRFQRALRQRNVCLKLKKLAAIEGFEWEMARSAHYLWQERTALLEELLPLSQAYFARLAGEEPFVMRYEAFQGDYLARLSKNRAQEVRLGFTKEGPHRDEIHFIIDDRPAKSFASEGQKRTATLALKLAEWQRLKETVQENPLCAIDEWQVNLDGTRKKNLRELLPELGQVFMTAPEMPEAGERRMISSSLALVLQPHRHNDKERL